MPTKPKKIKAWALCNLDNNNRICLDEDTSGELTYTIYRTKKEELSSKGGFTRLKGIPCEIILKPNKKK